MGRFSGDGDRVISGAAACMGQRAIGQGAWLISQRRIFSARELFDQAAAGKAAGFLV